MTIESKTVLYYEAPSGEEELGAFDSLGEASSLMHEHHEALYQSGEEMPPLIPVGESMGSPGEHFSDGRKGNYRIAPRRTKL